MDIAWYGVLSGSAQAFVAIYAARQGADALQLGLLNAGPALISLLVTLPAGQWLEQRPVTRFVFWNSVLQRSGYLIWAFLPLFFSSAKLEVWALILISLLMNIPAAGLSVGFNALFAAAVPPEWRGHVAGIRNALIALTLVLTSLLCGQILKYFPLIPGYQIVFALGFLGGAMSSYHLRLVRPLPATPTSAAPEPPAKAASRRNPLRLDVLAGPFRSVLGVLFLFHLMQYLPASLFPLYQVNNLHLTDQQLSLGTAVFHSVVFLGSLQLDWLSRRLSHFGTTALGALMMSFYPAMLSISGSVTLFLITSAVGGLAWSLVGGALANYLLEQVPEHDRPAHLAWYNLALNGAILIGSLSGPVGADWLGIVPMLGIAAGCRFLAALAILAWGRPRPVPVLAPQDDRV